MNKIIKKYAVISFFIVILIILFTVNYLYNLRKSKIKTIHFIANTTFKGLILIKFNDNIGIDIKEESRVFTIFIPDNGIIILKNKYINIFKNRHKEIASYQNGVALPSDTDDENIALRGFRLSEYSNSNIKYILYCIGTKNDYIKLCWN